MPSRYLAIGWNTCKLLFIIVIIDNGIVTCKLMLLLILVILCGLPHPASTLPQALPERGSRKGSHIFNRTESRLRKKPCGAA